jgi:hypothetical protein
MTRSYEVQRLTWSAIRFTAGSASTPAPEYKRDTACCSSVGKEATKECCLRDLSKVECMPDRFSIGC